jgi:DNA-binding SARP family transcriptional activator
VDVRAQEMLARQLLKTGEDVDIDSVDHRALLAGELLPDWYDEWVLFERERLRELRLHALEALATRLPAAHRWGAAMDAALAAVAADPLRESAHRVVIETHLAEGNCCEAIRHYVLFRDLLRRRIGIEPSVEVGQLLGDLPIPSSRIAASSH